MTDTFSLDRWSVFENSGRVSDYLYYKGIGVQKISRPTEAAKIAEDDTRSGNRGEGAGGQ
ncbi:MAG: hypothetical protein K2K57_03465 [Oscillospiraceae bacterium]|nr:hypothetical protein [Oscillospiraceae bacterium]